MQYDFIIIKLHPEDPRILMKPIDIREHDVYKK